MYSLGFVEVSGLTCSIEALDAMLKTADVEFVTCEKKLGGRLVTIIVKGSVSAVSAAVEAGKIRADKVGKTISTAVIANPHSEILKLIEISKNKLMKSRIGDK